MAHCLPLLIADERRGDNGDATSDAYEAFSPARRAVRKTCADKTAASRGDRSRAPAPRSACHSVTRVTTVESTARPVSGWLNAIRKGARNRETGGSPVREGAADIMATTTKTIAATNGSRNHELRMMLEGRRRELVFEVQGKIRDGRRDFTNEREVLDEGDSSEVDIQEDIEFALIQMKAETLNKIDAALRRLEEGTYGVCFECGDEIAEARLRALPFAVRCKDCEEAREAAELRERMTQRRGSSTLFVDMVN